MTRITTKGLTMPVTQANMESRWIYFWLRGVPDLYRQAVMNAVRAKGLDAIGAQHPKKGDFCALAMEKNVSERQGATWCKEALAEYDLPPSHFSSEKVFRYFFEGVSHYKKDDEARKHLQLIRDKNLIHYVKISSSGMVCVETTSEPPARFFVDVVAALSMP